MPRLYVAVRVAMSRSLLLRLTPFISARIRYNQRLLSSAVGGNPSTAQDAVHMTDNCIRRMKELHAKEAPTKDKMLRLTVETGGCSGFQYIFLLDDKTNPDDRIFEKDGVKLAVDQISYDFVKGATVDYVEELIRSAFLVSSNPSAVGGCSCKSSFMVK
ncbi:iron-sulfur assembly protein IscA-like 2, mitochondrial [Telopea speciosissima]|uniref:iron-sulfur assembly protein IscA-like 2, mitochondrial n=1 Tax=Telopea speciosissima TaxID=54955 RepID=UPI001CC5FB69|nr:iron-sulfur assembly protein IscA-like 2, mitochondrial [Telopea speciosissima]